MDKVDNTLSLKLFSVGGTQITLGTLLAVIAVLIITFILIRLAPKLLRRALQLIEEPDSDASKVYIFATRFLIGLVGLVIATHLLGIQLTAIFAAGGFFALGAGFAVKDIVENFLSGGILRLEKTIQPGDLIVVRDRWLFIHTIGLRTIQAETFSGEQVLIPNTLVAQSTVENLTRGNRLCRIRIYVGVAYESDLALVRKTLEELIENLEWRSVSTSRKSSVRLIEFGESSVNYALSVWIDDASNSKRHKSDLHEAVWSAFKDNNITIAYPQLVVHTPQNSNLKPQ